MSQYNEKRRLVEKDKTDYAGTGQSKSLFFGGMYLLLRYLHRHRHHELSHDDIKGHYNFGVTEQTFKEVRKILDKKTTNDTKRVSFLNVWFRFTCKRMIIQIFTILLTVFATMITFAFIPHSVIFYLEQPYNSNQTAWTLVAASMALFAAGTLLLPITFQLGAEIGYRFRCGLIALVFNKLLKLRYNDSSTIANVMTIVNQGSLRVFITCTCICYIPDAVITLVASLVYLYILVGIWSLVGIGIFTIALLLRVLTGFLNVYVRRKMLVYTECRVGKLREILQSISLIKMYGWEDIFLKSIEDARKKEMFYNFLALLNSTISTNFVTVVPSVASIVTLYCYYLAFDTLYASTSFTVLAIFNIAHIQLISIGLSFKSLGEMTVAGKRVDECLCQADIKLIDNVCRLPNDAIEAVRAHFSWNQIKDIRGDCNSNIDQAYQLHDIHLAIQRKTLVGICGTVGSGKSSLISALISRMDLISGSCAVEGTVGYVPQQAWIFNATFRENILFGQKFDQKRYDNVLNACSLIEDVQMFPRKDMSEIGERGLNLSGGQKQRISLARAVYKDCDMYFLDDPLSAMDVHVGKHVFMSCIKKILKDKTVLLVTHQMQYLEWCDEIIVMNAGCVSEIGTHNELIEKRTLYCQLNEHYVQHKIEEEDVKVTKNVKNKKQHTDRNILANDEGLTGKESTVLGSVSLETICKYIRACGGFFIAFLVIFVYVVCVTYQTFVAWWLSLWIEELQHYAASNQTDKDAFFDPNYTSEDVINLNKYPTVFILSIAILIGLSVFQAIFVTKVLTKGATYLHKKALRQIIKSPMTFFDTNPIGRIMNRFTADMDIIDTYIPIYISLLCPRVFIIMLSLIVAIVQIPWLLLLCIPVAVMIFVSIKLVMGAISQITRLKATSFSLLLSHVNTTASGLYNISTFGQSNNMWKKAMELTDINGCLMYICSNITRWHTLIVDIFAKSLTFGTIIILVFTKGWINSAFAGLVLLMCIKIMSPISVVVYMFNEVSSKFISVERLGEYCDLKDVDKEDVIPQDKVSNNWPIKGHVQFSNVSMQYRPNTPSVLRNISFCALPGENIGIVGRTGAGKSSIMAALFRLYDLSNGKIHIDGVDISTIDKTILRNNIFNIPQDPVLFNGTVRFNLDPFGMFSDEKLWETLNQVHMRQKIRKYQQKLDYTIQEGGNNLSVGERQLLCLGRAILRKPCVLMLDEATASIDTNTDFKVQRTIREHFSTCTIITIAHRLNTILHCDRVIVLDHGEIFESGTVTDLLSDVNSEFYSMYNAQSLVNST